MRERIQKRFAISDLEIERYLCGDLAPDEAKRVEQAAASDSELARHLDERRAERAAFFVVHPVLPPRPAKRAPARRRWGMPLGLAAAAVCSLWLFVGLRDPVGPLDSVAPPPDVRARGAFKVSLSVLRGDRTFVHRSGVVLLPGDRVRASIESPRAGYLSLVGRDAGGRVEVYYDGIRITPGTFVVPDSLVLDDYVGLEEWTFVLTTEPPRAGELAARVKRRAPLPGAATVVTLEKGPP